MTTPGHLVLRIDEATPGYLVKRNCRDGPPRYMDRSGRMVVGRSRAKVFAPYVRRRLTRRRLSAWGVRSRP